MRRAGRGSICGRGWGDEARGGDPALLAPFISFCCIEVVFNYVWHCCCQFVPGLLQQVAHRFFHFCGAHVGFPSYFAELMILCRREANGISHDIVVAARFDIFAAELLEL